MGHGSAPAGLSGLSVWAQKPAETVRCPPLGAVMPSSTYKSMTFGHEPGTTTFTLFSHFLPRENTDLNVEVLTRGAGFLSHRRTTSCSLSGLHLHAYLNRVVLILFSDISITYKSLKIN